MFKEDQKVCQEMAADDIRYFYNTLMFVCISIREQTHQLESLMQKFYNGGRDTVLFGFKRETFNYIEQNLDSLFERYRSWLLAGPWEKHSQRTWEKEVMLYCLRIPGFGMAKAGFLSTLLTGVGWCADVNNLEWFGIDDRTFYVSPSTGYVNKCVRVDKYLNIGQRLGGTEYLWNNWCQKISEKYPKEFPKAQDVSTLHWRIHQHIPKEF